MNDDIRADVPGLTMKARDNSPTPLRAAGLPPTAALLSTMLAGLLVTGCAATRWDPPPAPQAAAPSGDAQRSQRGNPPFYEVFGRRYYVMDSSYGYRERGVASWYGRKFHGNPTSSGEIYDMHALTAAHKTLPLPTRARVTNLSNGRSVIVRINDRGPFVDNRLIDLSYAAARTLDMIGSGTTLVEVESLDGASAREPAIARTSAPAPRESSPAAILNPVSTAVAEPAPAERELSLYLQVGAFGERANAERLRRKLAAGGIPNVVIRYDGARQPALYRVRLGPITGVAEYDALVDRVASLDIRETQLVTEGINGGAPGG